MQIVHVYDGHERIYRGRGSVPAVVWNLARETAAAGHEVTVIERQWDGLAAAAEHEDVRFRRLALRTGPDEPWQRIPYELVGEPTALLRLIGDRTNFATAAYRHLSAVDPDVVHVHLPFAANVLAMATPWLRSKLVYTAHLGELRMGALDADGVDVPSVLQYVSPDAFLAKRAARTTVLNESVREALLDAGLASDRLSVVPNGVDVDRFRSPDAETVAEIERRFDRSGVTVLSVGTIMPRKGVVELVEAFARTAAAVDSDVDLVVAGESDLDGAYTDRVRDAIEDAGLDDRVRMTGFVPAEELPALYALADVLAVPSLEEGFGMTTIEGMAAGTPAVATRVGGLPDVIDDGENGLLVPPGDVERLANGLTRLVEAPVERERMGERAAERARDYSWSAVTADVVSLYEEVAARG